ncbi:MAG TPA: PAS domain S-box protein [Bauldia sp.]|nr:PAS domain S-box protein [Bauldia sp.]
MVAVFVVDGHQRCRFLNAVAEVLTGTALARARQQTLGELLWRGQSVPFPDSGLGRALVSGEGGEGEETIVAFDGQARPFAFRAVRLGDNPDHGTVLELVDLSGETGTARALRESEQRLRLAIEATGIGIWDVNAATGKRQWSAEMYAILGLPQTEEADQERFSELIHADERAVIDHIYDRAYTSPASPNFNAEFRIRRANDGAERWVAVSGRVTFDASGKPVRGIGTIRDIHERRLTEEALRESEGRLRVALSAGRMGTWSGNFRTGEQRWDATQYALFGVSPGVKPSRELFLSLVHPEDTAAIALDPTRLPAPGTFLDSEFRIERPDGEERWITASSLVLYDSNGQPFEVIGINRDITEQKAAEEALRLSEEQNRLAIESNDVGTWDYDMVTGAHHWSPIFKRLWGLPPDAPADPALLHPLASEKDWERTHEVWQQGSNPDGDGRVALEYEVTRADDGARRWCSFAGQIFMDPVTRKPLRAVGIMTDVTERRAIEERQRLILREMNHRVKNSLALVQAIVSQTIRMTKDPQVAFERIQSRLMSLARTHDFLNKGNWAGVSLRALISGELEPFVGAANRFQLRGEQVVLDSSAMFALGLTIHELAANAVRHGALSVPEGTVDIDWFVTGANGSRRIEIDWVERNGPEVEKPTRSGFGSRLIEANVRATLGGDVDIKYSKSGLRATLSFPLRPISQDSLPEQSQPAS